MFHTARLKLTAWYLVIITLIMMVFSMAIYQVTTLELERGLRRFQNHFVNGELGAVPPRFPRQEVNNQVIENLELAKHLILIRLLTIDGVILLLSAVAGYFLAGKTLKPIERSLKEQKRFVADASHELKTPLTALKTSTEVTLRSKKLSLAKAKQALESNLEEIESLSHLSNDLLRLTKLQSNGELINKKTFKLKKLIQEASKKLTPLIKKKQIKLELDLNNIAVKADQKSLTQVIVILLDNAIKYSKKGGRVWVNTRELKKKVVIEVKDEGCGIAQKDLPHIFDRFYRADKARTKDSIDGFGLGLSLAKEIIELHGGRIEVESEVGVGSRFRVIL
jgi:two-component system, OmpR family, sensor histidine kinase CiaH